MPNSMTRRRFLSQSKLVFPALALGAIGKSAGASQFLSCVMAESVCDRSPTVFRALEILKSKKCDTISEADLLTVESLELEHIHLPAFKDTDFVGLTELKKLEFYSLFHTLPGPFKGKTFKPLQNLQELIIGEEISVLDDDAFAEIGGLKVFDILDSYFETIPQSLLEFPSLEVFYCTSNSFERDEDYEKVKAVYGDRVKESR